MARSYRYVSGDSHLEVHSDRWVPRVPRKYQAQAPHVVQLPDGSDAWVVAGGRPLENSSDLYGGKGRDQWQPFGQRYATTPGTGSPEQRLAEQDRDGIDAEVLFPGASGPRLWRNIPDDGAYRAVVRAYNDFLGEDYCPAAPDRLIGLGILPWTGVKDAIAEMEHCADMGLKGVMLGTFPSGHGSPSEEDNPFWEAALSMRMPIAIHSQLDRSGNRSGPMVTFPAASKEVLERIGPSRDFGEQLCKFARAGGTNAVQFVLGGVFERFPDLQIFFAETQIGWIPCFFEMADARYDRHVRWAEELLGFKPLDALPSEIIRRHCFWGFQHDRGGVKMRHDIGVNRVIWATDFPHQDSEWPNSMGVLERDFADVPADEKRRITAQNAIDFFHLEQ